jgi:hypothetical protein
MRVAIFPIALAVSITALYSCGGDDSPASPADQPSGGGGGEDSSNTSGGDRPSEGGSDQGSGTGGEGPVTSGGGGGAGGAEEDLTPGSLNVTVGELPAETHAAPIVITGPGGYSETITGSETLEGLTPGVYTIGVPPARRDGPLIDEAYAAVVTDSPAEVVPGEETYVDITYSIEMTLGSRMLWTLNGYDNTALGFEVATIDTTGANSAAPDVTLQLPESEGVSATAIAFDYSGNLWVGYCGASPGQAVVGFAPDKLAESGDSVPDVTIAFPDDDLRFRCVRGMALAPDGALWFAFFDGYVAKFDAGVLKSGEGEPSVVLTGASFSSLTDLSFDSNGSLWVASYGFGGFAQGAILRIDENQLLESNDHLTPGGWTWGDNYAIYAVTGFARSGAATFVVDSELHWLATIAPSWDDEDGVPDAADILTMSAVNWSPAHIALDEAAGAWIAGSGVSRIWHYDAATIALGGEQLPTGSHSGGGAINAPIEVRINPPAE